VERQVLTMFIAACRSFSQIEFSWTKKKKKIITLSLGELSSWGIFHQRITEGYFQSFSV
jgi:hypothetical protein